MNRHLHNRLFVRHGFIERIDQINKSGVVEIRVLGDNIHGYKVYLNGYRHITALGESVFTAKEIDQILLKYAGLVEYKMFCDERERHEF